MGWLWSSSTPSKPTAPTPSYDSPPIQPPEQSQPPPSTAETFQSPSDAPPPPQSSQSDLSEADLHAFLTSLSSQSQQSSSQQPKFRTSLPPTSPSSPSPTATPLTPSHLHPSTLSTRSAFDLAFYCQSLGGQFNAIYRHGTLRDCSPLWSEFWSCLRINRARVSEEERSRKVVEFCVRREGGKYGRGRFGNGIGGGGVGGGGEGRSSEDVWEQRRVLVGSEGEGDGEGRFEGDYEALEREWEKARRREEGNGEGKGEKRVGNGRGAMGSLYGGF